MASTQERQQYRVRVLGAPLHVGNLGCRALAASVIQGILRFKPNADVCLLYGNRSPDTVDVQVSGRTVATRVVNFRLSPRARLSEHLAVILVLACVHRFVPLRWLRNKIEVGVPWIRELVPADFVGQIHGGDSFSDIYGLRRLVIAMAQDWIVFLLGKELVLLPQTYGPYRSRVARLLARFTLRRSARILSRDAESCAVVRDLVGRRLASEKLAVSPDVAFTLESEPLQDASITPPLPTHDGPTVIGFNISGLLYKGGYTHSNMFGLRADYKELVHDLLLLLLRETDALVLLVPHVIGQETYSDVGATEDVWERVPAEYRCRVHRLVGTFNQSQAKHVIGLCHFFIGSRMHACIAALSQGIPAIGVAYSRKFAGVFESVGVEDMVLDARELSKEQILAACIERFREHAQIKGILAERLPLATVRLREVLESVPIHRSAESAHEDSQRKRGVSLWNRRIERISDVVEWRLCTGCGACRYVCPQNAVSLFNVVSQGIRPVVSEAACARCSECLEICPGLRVLAPRIAGNLAQASRAADGPDTGLEIWEGHAADEELRYQASSGGVLSAIALYCLEKESMAFVLHVGMDESQPWLNRTVQSRDRGDVLSRVGSRYSPSSPCEDLHKIEESVGPCVFIGKPCDVAAVSMVRRHRTQLDQKLGLVMNMFCAGTPNTQATLDLLDSTDVPLQGLQSLKYRGNGWPGEFRVAQRNGREVAPVPYESCWGRLNRHRPLRCHLCPDGLGVLADISCGDAWHRFTENRDAGRSIVIVRTERGREILHRAMASGYVQLERSDSGSVQAAQPGLLSRRQALFGRLAALRVFGIPIPRFRGFSLFEGWLRLSPVTMIRSVLGTLKRIVLRGLWHRDRQTRHLLGPCVEGDLRSGHTTQHDPEKELV